MLTQIKFLGIFLPLTMNLSSLAFAEAESTEPLALYEESIDSDEGAELASIVRDLRKLEEEVKPAHRSFHAKTHGCVSGELRVLAERPDYAKVGFFRETKSYRVVLRFTNGSGRARPDSAKDVRGIAVKAFDFEGEKLLVTQSEAKTQDFLMNNIKTGFTKDPREFADFILRSSRGTMSTLWFLATHWDFAKRLIKETSHISDSLIKERYWSGSAFRLGEKAMQYNIQSCGPKPEGIPNKEDPNFLRQELADYVKQQGMCWSLGIQLQMDPVKTPIEDPTVEWQEDLSPTVAVAQIHIPRQDMIDPEVMKACEQLTFTPWHTTEDHRPLGKINRLRRPAYAMEQKILLGGQHPVEPNDFPVKLITP